MLERDYEGGFRNRISDIHVEGYIVWVIILGLLGERSSHICQDKLGGIR